MTEFLRDYIRLFEMQRKYYAAERGSAEKQRLMVDCRSLELALYKRAKALLKEREEACLEL